jgi:hypothetical protein
MVQYPRIGSPETCGLKTLRNSIVNITDNHQPMVGALIAHHFNDF